MAPAPLPAPRLVDSSPLLTMGSTLGALPLPSLLPAAQHVPCDPRALFMVLCPTSGAAEREALGPNPAFAGWAFPPVPWASCSPSPASRTRGCICPRTSRQGPRNVHVHPKPYFTRWLPRGRPPCGSASRRTATYPARLWSHRGWANRSWARTLQGGRERQNIKGPWSPPLRATLHFPKPEYSPSPGSLGFLRPQPCFQD